MSEQNIIDQIAGEEEEIPQDDEETGTDDGAGEGEDQASGEEQDGGEGEQQADGADKGRQSQQMVPLAALEEARGQTKGLRDELGQTRERMAKMEALFQQLTGQNKEEEAEIPRMEDDPAAHLSARIEQMQKQLEGLTGENKQVREREQQQARERQFLDTYAASAKAFSDKNPDFNDAYAHLAKSVEAQLIARGYDDPVERKNVMDYEEGLLVGRAMKAGKDPAETIYSLAKHFGYAKAEGGQGGEDKLTRIQKGQQASQTLNGSGGSEGTTSLEELARLADADPAKFDAEWEKARKRGMLG